MTPAHLLRYDGLVSMPHMTVATFIALLLNAAYLVALPSASVWYYLNVGLHPILGLALAVLLARRRSHPPWAHSILAITGLVLLASGLLIGCAVAVIGATRQFAVILQLHVLTSTLGAALFGIHIVLLFSGDVIFQPTAIPVNVYQYIEIFIDTHLHDLMHAV